MRFHLPPRCQKRKSDRLGQPAALLLLLLRCCDIYRKINPCNYGRGCKTFARAKSPFCPYPLYGRTNTGPLMTPATLFPSLSTAATGKILMRPAPGPFSIEDRIAVEKPVWMTASSGLPLEKMEPCSVKKLYRTWGTGPTLQHLSKPTCV